MAWRVLTTPPTTSSRRGRVAPGRRTSRSAPTGGPVPPRPTRTTENRPARPQLRWTIVTDDTGRARPEARWE